MRVQYGDMTTGMLRIVGIVRPCVHAKRGWMPDQIKDFNNSLPHRLTLECFLHWHAFNMRSIRAMYAPDYVAQFF